MDTSKLHSLATLPWSTDLAGLVAEAAAADDAAGCLFAIADEIPAKARPGFAALVVAYTRDGEPVTIFNDGSALLLVTEGGLQAARNAADRILGEMRRLGLEQTLRVGVVAVDAQPDTLADRARDAAERAEPGAVAS